MEPDRGSECGGAQPSHPGLHHLGCPPAGQEPSPTAFRAETDVRRVLLLPIPEADRPRAEERCQQLVCWDHAAHPRGRQMAGRPRSFRGRLRVLPVQQHEPSQQVGDAAPVEQVTRECRRHRHRNRPAEDEPGRHALDRDARIVAHRIVGDCRPKPEDIGQHFVSRSQPHSRHRRGSIAGPLPPSIDPVGRREARPERMAGSRRRRRAVTGVSKGPVPQARQPKGDDDLGRRLGERADDGVCPWTHYRIYGRSSGGGASDRCLDTGHRSEVVREPCAPAAAAELPLRPPGGADLRDDRCGGPLQLALDAAQPTIEHGDVTNLRALYHGDAGYRCSQAGLAEPLGDRHALEGSDPTIDAERHDGGGSIRAALGLSSVPFHPALTEKAGELGEADGPRPQGEPQLASDLLTLGPTQCAGRGSGHGERERPASA